MKIVFAGSPEYAVPTLEKLTKVADVVAVVTQPDRPQGRKKIVTPTPVKKFAQSVGIKTFGYAKISEHADELRALGADVMITCAYGQILSREILGVFARGVWNLHASLLPKFRGASPIQSAILAGEEYTGVTVMRTEPELDTGDIMLVKRIAVDGMNAGELAAKLSALSAEAAAEAVEYLKEGEPQLLMQHEPDATYCKKITKADAKLDFSRGAEEICRAVRALNPQPLAYCMHGGNILNILSARPAPQKAAGKCGEVLSLSPKAGCFTVACGDGAVEIYEVLPAGGKKLCARDFINGRKIKAGDVLD